LRRKDHELPKHRRPTRLRHTAAATVVATASAAVVLGANAWAAEGQARVAEPAVTRIGDLPDGASVTRGGTPAGQALAKVEKRHRVQAARAAREARQRRAAASRSATRTVSYGDPRSIARSMMTERYGWGSGEFSCLDTLWEHESSWDPHAENPSSGAYGIPQALPGSKMSAYGADWQSSPVTQIEWGLAYIRQSYASPCGAWSVWQSKGWY
jgi:hypothetical protein